MFIHPALTRDLLNASPYRARAARPTLSRGFAQQDREGTQEAQKENTKGTIRPLAPDFLCLLCPCLCFLCFVSISLCKASLPEGEGKNLRLLLQEEQEGRYLL